ncbi:MAG: hypothetical protein JSS45_10545 [Proteobacteria bacterium]|nr:hypothetical protein [Pseudomonadota bacterium]
MTTAVERTRALLWGGAFLMEVARDKSLPLTLRRQAVVIARHFPTIEQIAAMARLRPVDFHGTGLASPDEIPPDTDIGKFGPLKASTRLAWPEEG